MCAHALATVLIVTTAPISTEQLRQDVADVLARYGLTVEQFIDADIDDLEEDELRDLWLTTRDVLATA